MFMAYKNVLQLDDAEMISVFKACKSIGALAQVHAENGDIIEEVHRCPYQLCHRTIVICSRMPEIS